MVVVEVELEVEVEAESEVQADGLESSELRGNRLLGSAGPPKSSELRGSSALGSSPSGSASVCSQPPGRSGGGPGSYLYLPPAPGREVVHAALGWHQDYM